MIMLGSVKNEGLAVQYSVQPNELGGRQTAGVYLVVEDCDRVYADVQASGAKVIQELHEPDYGGKAFLCIDPEGFLWSVGSYDPWRHHG